MAKFISNSLLSQSYRRAAATGMSKDKILDTLKSLSEKRLDSEGNTAPSEDRTMEDILQTICNLESTGSGYLYGGEFASLNGESVFRYRCHHSKDYDDTDHREFETHNFRILRDAEDGSILRIGKSSNQSCWEDYRKEGRKWISLGGWDGSLYDCALQHINSKGFFLGTGVRKEVANTLGYDYDRDFHFLFDQVVSES